jgi:hypothetical protein
MSINCEVPCHIILIFLLLLFFRQISLKILQSPYASPFQVRTGYTEIKYVCDTLYKIVFCCLYKNPPFMVQLNCRNEIQELGREWVFGFAKTMLNNVLRIMIRFKTEDILTCIPIARQRLRKHNPAEANAHNRTYITRQRISKHSSLTTERSV